MNKLSRFVVKFGMMDRFGYTMVHAGIDVAIIFGIALLIGKLVANLA